MHASEYVSSFTRECSELSVSADVGAVKVEAARVKMKARLALNDEAFVDAFEVVDFSGGVARRIKYGYRFVEGGIERFGYDLDPTHNPPAHEHRLVGHPRQPARVVTVRCVLEEAWEATSQAAERVLSSPHGAASSSLGSSRLPQPPHE